LPRLTENESLNLSFADLPEGLVLVQSNDERIELAPRTPESGAAEDGDGTDDTWRRLWVEVGDVSAFGIDLVAKVNLQKELFEALPEGTYSGAREIVVPAAGGKAYYARGQYTDAQAGRVEETRVLLVHPTENRLVTFTSRYPETNSEGSSERVQELFAWVAEMSALRPFAGSDFESATDDENSSGGDSPPGS
jgi:hypothetical protein